jgi:hypothetical protein
MKLSEYSTQVAQSSWVHVPSWIWLMIINLGLDEELEAYQSSDWLMAELSLDFEDEVDLRALDDVVLEKFNKLNELVKNYNNQHILIDYENGRIFVVKVA